MARTTALVTFLALVLVAVPQAPRTQADDAPCPDLAADSDSTLPCGLGIPIPIAEPDKTCIRLFDPITGVSWDWACARSLPFVHEADPAACRIYIPEQPPGTYCVFMGIRGQGWSDITGTQGVVVASSHQIPYTCDWHWYESPSCTTSSVGGISMWQNTARKEDCHEVKTTTTVTSEQVIPDVFLPLYTPASHRKAIDCP